MPSPPLAEVEALLRDLRSPLLRGAFVGHAAALAPLLDDLRFRPDQMVCGDVLPSPGIWFCAEGQVAVWMRDSYTQDFPRTVGRGSAFGRYDSPQTQHVPVPEPPHFGHGLHGASAITHPPDSAPQDHLLARALVESRVWLLRWVNVGAFTRACPAAAPALQFLQAFAPYRARFALALTRAVAFEGVNLRWVDLLAECAREVSVGPGEVVVQRGQRFPGIMLMVSGGGTMVIPAPAGSDAGDDSVEIEPGDVLGEVLTLTGGPSPHSVTAGASGARLALVDRQALAALFDASPAFRRVDIAEGLQRTFSLVYSRYAEGDLLVLQGDAARLPLSELSGAICEELSETYGDPVLHVVYSDRVTTPRLSRGAKGGARLDVPAATVPAHPTPASLRRRLDEVLEGEGSRLAAWSQVWLDPWQSAARALPDRLAAAATRCVYVADEVQIPRWRDGLRPGARPLDMDDPPPVPALLVACVDPAVVPSLPLPAGCVRVKIDMGALRRGGRAALDSTSLDSLGRLGRAVTERLVGVALGGGGALGYAHLSLLYALSDPSIGVPVDIVAGASFGTVAGAYWCARGRDGLQMLVDDGARLNRVIAESSLWGGALQRFLERRFPEARLEQLCTTLLPVCTDLTTGAPYILRTGSVGRGARFSGAFPPLLSSVDWHGMRLVDGGFSDNVPTGIAAWEGANLLIASNIITAPPLAADPGQATWHRVLASLNPVRRFLDAGRAAMNLVHRAGEGRFDFARLRFEPSFSTAEFWDMSRGPQVVESAWPAAWQTAESVRDAWDDLRAPARPPGAGPA